MPLPISGDCDGTQKCHNKTNKNNKLFKNSDVIPGAISTLKPEQEQNKEIQTNKKTKTQQANNRQTKQNKRKVEVPVTDKRETNRENAQQHNRPRVIFETMFAKAFLFY